MLKLKEWIAKVSSSLRLVSTSTSSNLAYHSGKAYFWRQGSIVYFSINGSFTSLPAGGYTTLGTITQGFRPTNPTVFHRQEAGTYSNQNVGILLKLTNTGEISVYNYTGAVYTGNGYFNGCYACSENLNGVVPASSIPAGVADYVVEQGTSGIWTYRKWNSGIAECWGIWSGTLSHYSASGGFYAYYTSIFFPTGLFIEVPVPTYSSRTSGNGWALTGTQTGSLSKDSSNFYCLSSAAGSQTIYFYINVIGRWK